MKRWIIIALLALAVALLLAPALVGRLAEKTVGDNLSWIEAENDDIVIESERFTRGWFSSEGRHRISLRDGAFSELLGPSTVPNGSPALILETRIDHGLVPFTSMDRKEGTLQPGLASTVTTLQFDRGDGELVDLPGTVYSFIGLSGESTIHYLMEPGSQVAGNTTTHWSGADLTVVTSARNRQISVDGTILPSSVESYGVTTHIGEISIEAEQDHSRYAFGIGTLSLSVDSVNVQSAGTRDGGFGGLVLRSETGVDDDRVSGTIALTLTDLLLPDLDSMNLSTELTVDGLDADALATLVGALQTLNGFRPRASQAEFDAAYPSIEQALQTMANRGGRLEIHDLELQVPQGDLRSSLTVDWPESSADDAFSWPSLLLRVSAATDLSVSAALYDYLPVQVPEVGSLLAMGFIIRRGDRYEMEARYASGLLTVNGAPLPIPLGAPQ